MVLRQIHQYYLKSAKIVKKYISENKNFLLGIDLSMKMKQITSKTTASILIKAMTVPRQMRMSGTLMQKYFPYVPILKVNFMKFTMFFFLKIVSLEVHFNFYFIYPLNFDDVLYDPELRQLKH